VLSLKPTLDSIRDLVRNRNLAVLMATQTLFMFTAFLWWPYRSLFIMELGASVETLGLVLTVETIASILFQYPGGVLTDRWGRRRMLLIAGALRALSPLFYLLATNWLQVIPGVILASAGMLGLPANNALIAESLPPEKRGTGFSAYRTVTSTPTIVTALLGGVVMDRLGVLKGCRLILLGSLAAAILSLALRWLYITETLDPQTHPSQSHAGPLSALKGLPKTVWLLVAVGAISMFATRVMMSFMVVYGVEVVGLTKTQWGLIGTVVSLLTTAITTPAGILADKMGKKPLILASRILGSTSILLYTVSNSFTHMLLVRGLTGIAGGLGGAMWGPMGGPLWQALVADASPPRERGKVMGLIGTVGSLVSSPASWLGGYMFDNVSPKLPFQTSFALDMLGTALLLAYLNPQQQGGRGGHPTQAIPAASKGKTPENGLDDARFQ